MASRAMNTQSMRRRSNRAVATVSRGAETAARSPGMVIIRPAIPSEMVKLDPIDVSRPIGKISVVTIEKSPSITEATASQPMRGDRVGNPVSPEGVVAVVVEAMNSIL
ncbi:hypothetical protein HEK616_82090 (plasmid) [Streptomyces nigrescens]|uniref:Uncharacterized protein n=1 Tax=Streptomyces nigrescens TaxID=1920 RepID=A0ABN6R8N5_STRNI|nr:hypothetical protein HEK616_82090 [Streptomyces nigrescens]